jgi:hypothetical protein
MDRLSQVYSIIILVLQGLGLVLAYAVYLHARKTAREATHKMQNISVSIDGRLSQLLELTARDSHKEGVLAEKAEVALKAGEVALVKIETMIQKEIQKDPV